LVSKDLLQATKILARDVLGVVQVMQEILKMVADLDERLKNLEKEPPK
jgi:uncharacterized protein YoxC